MVPPGWQREHRRQHAQLDKLGVDLDCGHSVLCVSSFRTHRLRTPRLGARGEGGQGTEVAQTTLKLLPTVSIRFRPLRKSCYRARPISGIPICGTLQPER